MLFLIISVFDSSGLKVLLKSRRFLYTVLIQQELKFLLLRCFLLVHRVESPNFIAVGFLVVCLTALIQ